jgi:hypothetical protein
MSHTGTPGGDGGDVLDRASIGVLAQCCNNFRDLATWARDFVNADLHGFHCDPSFHEHLNYIKTQSLEGLDAVVEGMLAHVPQLEKSWAKLDEASKRLENDVEDYSDVC